MARLALRFGCSIFHLERTLPSSDLATFQALWEMEPWGYNADNYNAALIASTVARFSGRCVDQTKATVDLFATPPPRAD